MEKNVRSEIRIVQENPIFIATKVAAPGSGALDQIVICNSVDFSTNGICVLMDEQVPIGAIYQVFIETDPSIDALHVSAQVKWVMPHETGVGYKIGLSLFESDGTDICLWKEQMAESLLKPAIE